MNNEPSEIQALLSRARQGDAQAVGQLLEHYRAVFHRRAQRQLHGPIAARVGASDVVQQTFLEAHRDFGQFRGAAEPELLVWLERILDHNLARVIRDHAGLQKRDVRRERSLNQTCGEESTPHQELDAGNSTPSQRAMRGEEAERLAKALAALPEDQREAVRLRHLEGWALADIA
ncbi:MAG: sigma-70 family RNA polymerase sigma factor, partial [Planctomycetes bacterium]|nr:sigma-70 family RNA polymerase sigma factor [Planctomycetota bacterium]